MRRLYKTLVMYQQSWRIAATNQAKRQEGHFWNVLMSGGKEGVSRNPGFVRQLQGDFKPYNLSVTPFISCCNMYSVLYHPHYNCMSLCSNHQCFIIFNHKTVISFKVPYILDRLFQTLAFFISTLIDLQYAQYANTNRAVGPLLS